MKLLQLLDLISESQILLERDVINAGEIKAFCKQAAIRVQSPQGKTWLRSQLYTFLINRYSVEWDVFQIEAAPASAPEWVKQKFAAGAEIWHIDLSEAFKAQVGEVIDYINHLTQANPTMEIRFRYEEAVAGSQQWHHQLALAKRTAVSAEADAQLEAEGTDWHMDFPDGYRWVSVHSEACLDREGNRMGHCAGDYHQAVESGETILYSLRDPQNEPHVTVEVNVYDEGGNNHEDEVRRSYTVNQVKGKENQPPVAKYVPYVLQLMRMHTDLGGAAEIDGQTWGINNNGRTDLEGAGIYYRGDEFLTLMEIAKPILDFPNGWRWMGVPTAYRAEYSEQEWSINKYILIDQSEAMILDLRLGPSGTGRYRSLGKHTLTMRSKADDYTGEQLRPYVMALLDETDTLPKGMEDDFDLHHNEKKHGRADEVGTVMFTATTGHKLIHTSNDQFIYTPAGKRLARMTGAGRGWQISLEYDVIDTNIPTLAEEISGYTKTQPTQAFTVGWFTGGATLIHIPSDLPKIMNNYFVGKPLFTSQDGTIRYFKLAEQHHSRTLVVLVDRFKNPMMVVRVEHEDDRQYEDSPDHYAMNGVQTMVAWDPLRSGIGTYVIEYLQHLNKGDPRKHLDVDDVLYRSGWMNTKNGFMLVRPKLPIHVRETSWQGGEVVNEYDTTVERVLRRGQMLFDQDRILYKSLFDKGRYKFSGGDETGVVNNIVVTLRDPADLERLKWKPGMKSPIGESE